jgi:hypothetical protein
MPMENANVLSLQHLPKIMASGVVAFPGIFSKPKVHLQLKSADRGVVFTSNGWLTHILETSKK